VATAAVTATEHSGVALTPHAVPPDGVLDALTADLDLLVCGARGYGRLREMLAHGVARRLIGAAACPVVVVPRGTAAAFATLVTGAGRVGSVA
jgi:nucleotide-binding universal stress UspA family protein